jgi:hypothetical protein
MTVEREFQAVCDPMSCTLYVSDGRAGAAAVGSALCDGLAKLFGASGVVLSEGYGCELAAQTQEAAEAFLDCAAAEFEWSLAPGTFCEHTARSRGAVAIDARVHRPWVLPMSWTGPTPRLLDHYPPGCDGRRECAPAATALKIPQLGRRVISVGDGDAGHAGAAGRSAASGAPPGTAMKLTNLPRLTPGGALDASCVATGEVVTIAVPPPARRRDRDDDVAAETADAGDAAGTKKQEGLDASFGAFFALNGRSARGSSPGSTRRAANSSRFDTGMDVDRRDSHRTHGYALAAEKWVAMQMRVHYEHGGDAAAAARAPSSRFLWLNEGAETGAPYDIVELAQPAALGTSTVRVDEAKRFIEVKATRTGTERTFQMSLNEFMFAAQQGPKFHIYRVFRATESEDHRMSVQRIENPVAMWLEGRLRATGTIEVTMIE